MERSTTYRRALRPMMLYLGLLGLMGSVVASVFQIKTVRGFGLFWMGLGSAGLLGAFWLARRQALKDREPFWSPPARRVAQAVLPPLAAGAMLGFLLTFLGAEERAYSWAMPITWMLVYGCAVHSAGFFMPRGIKLLGWLFILGAGSLLLSSLAVAARLPMQFGHLIMGLFFGGLHLCYGIYLFATEPPARRP